MVHRLTIALDAMGSDLGPSVAIEGAERARANHPDVRFLMYGNREQIEPILQRFPDLARVAEVRHTIHMIEPRDRPSQALRKGRESSMWLAIEAVRKGEADAVVSAGNTGALMAIAKFLLRTLPDIDRPAIASFIPTTRGKTCMLDLGANVECNSNNLVQFAVMGAAFARIVLGLERPLVGLLNIGVEDLKGNDTVKAAGQILRDTNLPMEFYGFVEGDDLGAGTVDVVVTDGFTGNIALKTAEGTAKLFSDFLARAFKQSFLSRLGYMMARPTLEAVQLRMDPRAYNGAMFLGLNGIAVKSHGGTDATGYAAAIGVAVDMATENICAKIIEDFDRFGAKEDLGQQAAAS